MGHDICTYIALSLLGFERVCTRKKKQRTFLDYYEHLYIMGSGSMGTVSCIKLKSSTIQRWTLIRRYINKKSQQKKKKIFPSGNDENVTKLIQLYAFKKIKNSKNHNQKYIDEVKNELSALKRLDHVNIVHIHDVFERKTKVSLVLHLCTGGDLTARCPCNSEKQAASILHNILSAVAHMHHKGIMHRDLKLENIMFEDCTPESEIKIIDFGLSGTFKPGEILTRRVGSPYTLAPEVLDCNYTSKADLWSIGVITYMLLTNRSPFDQSNMKTLLLEIKSCNYNFDHDVWLKISNEAKDFISNLLVADPDGRMDANEALQHPWLTKFDYDEIMTNNNDFKDMIHDLYNNIESFSKFSYLKKAALMVMAHKLKSSKFALGENNVKMMRKLFRTINISGNGCITFKEFKRCFLHLNKSHNKICDMFKAMDFDNSGTITYTELLACSLEHFNRIDQMSVIDVFDRFDTDCSGYITIQKVNLILESYFDINEREYYVEENDEDKANERKQKIPLKEFLAYFR